MTTLLPYSPLTAEGLVAAATSASNPITAIDFAIALTDRAMADLTGCL